MTRSKQSTAISSCVSENEIPYLMLFMSCKKFKKVSRVPAQTMRISSIYLLIHFSSSLNLWFPFMTSCCHLLIKMFATKGAYLAPMATPFFCHNDYHHAKIIFHSWPKLVLLPGILFRFFSFVRPMLLTLRHSFA